MLHGSFRRQVRLAVPSYIILAALILIATIFSEYFRTLRNYQGIINQVTPLFIVTLGQAVVILRGGIDLSVGNVLALSTCILATYNGTLGLGVTIVICLLMGLVVGLVNGLGVEKLGLPPMIMTMASMLVVKGISLLIRPRSGGSVPYEMYSFFDAQWGILSTQLILLLLLFAITFYIIHMTKLGRHVYAVGSDELSARKNGISVEKVSYFCYMFASLMAAFAGIVMGARMSSGDALVGESFALDAITGAVVGGCSMSGGQGSIVGALSGALLVSMISNFLNMLGINPMVQYLVKGFILIIALAFKLKRDK